MNDSAEASKASVIVEAASTRFDTPIDAPSPVAPGEASATLTHVLLTRYILRSFLLNYLIALLLLLGLFVLLDMIVNFDEFSDVGGDEGLAAAVRIASGIGTFYLYQSALIFTQLAGAITAVAAAFTLLRFSRLNELTAMLAAGVSLQRVGLPVVLMASLINLVLVPIVQELIIPNIADELVQSRQEAVGSRPGGNSLQNLEDHSGGLVFARRYTPAGDGEPAEILDLAVVQTDADFNPTGKLLSPRATWDGQQWQLEGGTFTSITDDGGGEPQPLAVYESGLSPRELALIGKNNAIELFSTARLTALLENPGPFGVASLLRVKHGRRAELILNIAVVLLAAATCLVREPGRIRMAAGQCLVLVALAMGLNFICNAMAGKPPMALSWADRWPAALPWIPVLIFGPLGAWMYDRVRT